MQNWNVSSFVPSIHQPDHCSNRTLPNENIAEVAFAFGHFNLQALFIIGGFEAFQALSELRKGRETYEELKIPMIMLPATVSNNVPGTEYSLGSDTCLNALLEYIDTCRQSAESSRRRVFVIETQGGESGYIATMAGLACGALAVYTPEDGVTLDMVRNDITHLRDTFAKDHGQDKAGKIILVNEKASKFFNAQTLNGLIENEAKGRFDTRVGIPGHFQQGKVPTPLDRCRAVRFAVRSMQHLEKYATKTRVQIAEDKQSAAVIGIRHAKVSVTSMEYLEDNETDWKHRRPKVAHWAHMKTLGDILAGRPRTSTTLDQTQKFTVA
jgi:6-phosphofructokinase 1